MTLKVAELRPSVDHVLDHPLWSMISLMADILHTYSKVRTYSHRLNELVRDNPDHGEVDTTIVEIFPEYADGFARLEELAKELSPTANRRRWEKFASQAELGGLHNALIELCVAVNAITEVITKSAPNKAGYDPNELRKNPTIIQRVPELHNHLQSGVLAASSIFDKLLYRGARWWEWDRRDYQTITVVCIDMIDSGTKSSAIKQLLDATKISELVVKIAKDIDQGIRRHTVNSANYLSPSVWPNMDSRGDGAFISFESARDASAFANHFSIALGESEGSYRIGIATGPATAFSYRSPTGSMQSMEIVGEAVLNAHRLQLKASPKRMAICHQTWEGLDDTGKMLFSKEPEVMSFDKHEKIKIHRAKTDAEPAPTRTNRTSKKTFPGTKSKRRH